MKNAEDFMTYLYHKHNFFEKIFMTIVFIMYVKNIYDYIIILNIYLRFIYDYIIILLNYKEKLFPTNYVE
jgi:hypothetical protein